MVGEAARRRPKSRGGPGEGSKTARTWERSWKRTWRIGGAGVLAGGSEGESQLCCGRRGSRVVLAPVEEDNECQSPVGARASAVVLGECWRDDAPHGPASSGWWLMVNGKEKPLLD